MDEVDKATRRISIADETADKPGPAADEPDFIAGQTINDRYVVRSILGRGGMGVVYEVEQVMLQQKYALKTLSKDTYSETVFRRFQQEAKAAALADHPNLVRIQEVGLLPDQRPYLVMEYVDGITLEQRIKQSGPLTVDEAIPLIFQVCFGLGAAHERGIIHRDLKPSNIMLKSPHGESTQPTAKIVDFGIAKLVQSSEESGQALTRTGEIFGSPFYMSPEQCLGAGVDHRSDIYSLGCVMFEALTGFPPFMGETALSTMLKHQSERPPTLKEGTLGREFPEALESVIGRLLEKDPNRRYQSLKAVAYDLSMIKAGAALEDFDATHFPEVSKGRDTKKMLFYAGICLISAAFLFGAGTIFGRQSLTPVKPDETRVDIENVLPLPIEVNPVTTDRKFFSEKVDIDGVAYRIFKFPAPIGAIYGAQDGKNLRAYGTVKLPVSDQIFLHVTDRAIDDPTFLLNFRPDDLFGLNCHDNLSTHDHSLTYVSRLKSIHCIDLDKSDVSDIGLKLLEDLPYLSELSVDSTEITAEGLARFRNLKNLWNLDAGRIRNVRVLLLALKDSPSLKVFSISGSDLSDADVPLLIDLPNVDNLNLGSTAITDQAMKYISRLKKVTRLDIGYTRITSRSLNDLKSMRQLVSLTITPGMFSESQKRELNRAVPALQFYETRKPLHEILSEPK